MISRPFSFETKVFKVEILLYADNVALLTSYYCKKTNYADLQFISDRFLQCCIPTHLKLSLLNHSRILNSILIKIVISTKKMRILMPSPSPMKLFTWTLNLHVFLLVSGINPPSIPGNSRSKQAVTILWLIGGHRDLQL